MTTSAVDLDPAAQLTEPPHSPPSRDRGHRASLVALLAGTALLYIWGLGASGYANDFYAAAVQAGTKSWKAFFFGSFDSANLITVDKPPAALWPMEISGRLFGFNSWSMLVPQAIEGVLTVWLVHTTVKRWFGHWAGILAGALLAITPVAVLMFRFNNPDSLMVLLMAAAAYCTTRALEAASTKWLMLAGAAMGFSFLAKGLQPFTLLPALAIAYAVAAPTPLRRRLLQLLLACGALVAGAGWWVLAVDLTPAVDRPYIGGSGNNTALGLAFGYNGLSRISGNGSGGGRGGANFSGATGIGRLFNSLNGGQIAWLLPTSLLGLVALLVISRRGGWTDRARAAAILWGGWLVVTAAVLSFASGIIHTYYSVELAPPIAALVAVGTVVLWRHRASHGARVGLAAGAVLTGVVTYVLLHRTPSFHPEVGYLVALAGLAAAGLALARPGTRGRALTIGAVAAGVITLAGGSAAYALDTAATAHTGSVPSAGPTVAGGGLGGGARPGGARPGGARPGGALPGTGRPPAGAFPGGPPTGATRPAFPGGPTGAGPGGRAAGGGGASANATLTKLLKATTTKWAAAAIGSQSAGPLELASGKAVMAIGGFSGNDAAPTLAQFEKYVSEGKVSYFIAGGGRGGPNGGGGSSSAISAWVAAHYRASTVGGTTVYDLTTR
jgi:4-amino-4-deoxy-L-arabinose transferase-like glycosyltransferase